MLKRKLVFYRWSSAGGRRPFDPSAVAQRLDAAVRDDSAQQVIERDGVITAIEVVSVGGDRQPSRFRLLALRGEEDRPSKWDSAGSIGPIELRSHEYAADVTHVAIWPDGHCAHDSSQHGPRLSRMSFFLRHRMNEYVQFSPIYKDDTLEKLKEMAGQIRSFDLSMTKPEYSSQDRTTFGTLFPAVAGEKLPSVRVSLGMGRTGKRDRFIDQEIEEHIMHLAENSSDLLTGMIVRGRNKRTGQIQVVNLMKDKLGVDIEVQSRPGIRSVPRSEAIFHELDQAYKKFSQEQTFESSSAAEVTYRD